MAIYTPGTLCGLQFVNTIEVMEKLVNGVFQKNRFTTVTASAAVAPTRARIHSVEQLSSFEELEVA